MGKMLRYGLPVAMLMACMLISSCGESSAEKTQGFTQSLEEQQEEASEALKEFEQASEALDKAVEKKEAADNGKVN